MINAESHNLARQLGIGCSPAGETYHLPPTTYHYSNDAIGRRTAITRGGAAFGDLSGATDAYGYNLRSEVISSRRTLADSPVRGSGRCIYLVKPPARFFLNMVAKVLLQ